MFFIARSASPACASAGCSKKRKNLRKPANVGDRRFPRPEVTTPASEVTTLWRYTNVLIIIIILLLLPRGWYHFTAGCRWPAVNAPTRKLMLDLRCHTHNFVTRHAVKLQQNCHAQNVFATLNVCVTVLLQLDSVTRDKIVGVAAESLCCSDGCATYRRAVGPVG